MKNMPRYVLLAAIFATAYLLLVEWGKFSANYKQEVAQQSWQANESAQNNSTPQIDSVINNDGTTRIPGDEISNSQQSNDELPVAIEEQKKVFAPEEPVENKTASTELIYITTDTLQLRIDPVGGDVVYAALIKHRANIDNPDIPFVLLEQNPQRTYVAQSGLVGKNGTDTAEGKPVYFSEQKNYVMPEGAETFEVVLSYTDKSNALIEKVYSFTKDDYLVDVTYRIQNNGNENWQANLYAQLKRDSSRDPAESSGLGMAPFLGVATSTADEPFHKMDFKDLREDTMEGRKFKNTREGGWIAIIQHYYLSALIPEKDFTHEFSAFTTKSGMNLARFVDKATVIKPGEKGEAKFSLFVGPKDQYRLEEISPGLELSVDYGFLWWLAQPLYAVLNFFHSLTGNWGFAIILLTVSVKILFFYPSAMSYRSMANMRRIQPQLVSLREQHKDDRQKQSQAMMKLYKEEKVNPLGGCLPILIQMPVFLALYWVLLESVELRHAPFIGYINDLSAQDPYFILPIVMVLSMWFQQKLNPPPPDPMQAKMMQIMPFAFGIFFLFFPAGLVLYWVVNNLLSIAQQWVITKNIEKKHAAKQ